MALSRPTHPRIETFNDWDHHLANFWRSVQAAPDKVAEFADWPVNEVDLHARHRYLVGVERPEPFVPERWDAYPDLRAAWLAGYLGSHRTYAAAFREKMLADPHHYDPKLAGWWVWGICCWIGGGWCSSQGQTVDGDVKQQLPAGHAKGLGCKLPDISGKDGGSGRGIHQASMGAFADKAPQLTKPLGAGGVNIAEPTVKRPALGAGANKYGERTHAGHGVNGKAPSDSHRPQLADAFSRGRGVHGNDAAEACEARRKWLTEWMRALADRLRTARVCCGDWKRVCDSESVTTRLGTVGVFFDAPYKTKLATGKKNRSDSLYSNDRAQDVNQLVDDVIAYCVERGVDPLMRIAACGYEGEGYEVLEELGWTVMAWKSSGGYANRGADKDTNAVRERIWFSPGCLDPNRKAPTLFEL